MPIVNFVYRYIFRGIRVVLVVGMLTILLLTIYSQVRGERAHHAGKVPAAEKKTR